SIASGSRLLLLKGHAHQIRQCVRADPLRGPAREVACAEMAPDQVGLMEEHGEVVYRSGGEPFDAFPTQPGAACLPARRAPTSATLPPFRPGHLPALPAPQLHPLALAPAAQVDQSPCCTLAPAGRIERIDPQGGCQVEGYDTADPESVDVPRK